MPQLSENLLERSYNHIMKQLCNGTLKPGDRLVNRKLASEIGVSVNPLREAIQRLTSQGFIEHIPGSGSFVRQISPEDLYETYVLRDAIESRAAAEAARYITPQQLNYMKMLLEEAWEMHTELSQNPTDHSSSDLFNRWMDFEERFHVILMEASRNKLLTKVINEHRVFSTIIESYRFVSAEIFTPENVQATCHDKEQLVKALQDHDSVLAQKLMSQLIQRPCDTIVSIYRKNLTKRSHFST